MTHLFMVHEVSVGVHLSQLCFCSWMLRKFHPKWELLLSSVNETSNCVWTRTGQYPIVFGEKLGA